MKSVTDRIYLYLFHTLEIWLKLVLNSFLNKSMNSTKNYKWLLKLKENYFILFIKTKSFNLFVHNTVKYIPFLLQINKNKIPFLVFLLEILCIWIMQERNATSGCKNILVIYQLLPILLRRNLKFLCGIFYCCISYFI